MYTLHHDLEFGLIHSDYIVLEETHIEGFICDEWLIRGLCAVTCIGRQLGRNAECVLKLCDALRPVCYIDDVDDQLRWQRELPVLQPRMQPLLPLRHLQYRPTYKRLHVKIVR